MPGRISENHVQTLRDRDTWAVYKLWTNWSPVRPAAGSRRRAPVSARQLCRSQRGGRGDRPGRAQTHREGEAEEITLRIGAAAKSATGYQLAVTLPDKDTEAALRDFYGPCSTAGR